MNAPTYKIVKYLVRLLKRHLAHKNHYNVKNSISSATDLTELKLNKNHQMITFDMKDLYINIPIDETLIITKSMLLKDNDAQITQQIITLMEIILSQTYFTFQNKIYHSEKGVSMGSPLSSTIAENFLQDLEEIHIKRIIDTQDITFYTRHVDDILIIYDTTRTNINLINNCINQIHPNIKLNLTHESKRSISFLDFPIIRKDSNLEIDIYRKPTTTDTTINFLSNHTMEHKIAAYRHHITRMQVLPLKPNRKQTEWSLIKLIAQNNNFPQKLIQNLKHSFSIHQFF